MLKKLIFTVGLVVVLAHPAQADPKKFTTQDSAANFCKAGNVVWFNPDSKVYFPPGSQYYGKTKTGGYTCKALADKEGYRQTKGN